MWDLRYLPEEPGRSSFMLDGEEVFVYHEVKPASPVAPEGYYGDFHQWKIRIGPHLEMSIVRGPGTYGYSQGKFEIAFIDLDDGELSDRYEEQWDDTVLGYLKEPDVIWWYKKASKDAGF